MMIRGAPKKKEVMEPPVWNILAQMDSFIPSIRIKPRNPILQGSMNFQDLPCFLQVAPNNRILKGGWWFP